MCPNDIITQFLICNDSYAYGLEWEVKPYTGVDDGLVYHAARISDDMKINRSDTLFSELLEFDRINQYTGSITTSLRVKTSIVETVLNVTCTTLLGVSPSHTSTSTLHIAGYNYRLFIMSCLYQYFLQTDIPHHNNSSFTYKENETYFTAILELVDMFDGEGVPIDHYIIQVDNGTQLETAGPTYSFDIMYNTTLSVNISAHNCAGYSDPFPLEIEYQQGRGVIQKLIHVLNY